MVYKDIKSGIIHLNIGTKTVPTINQKCILYFQNGMKFFIQLKLSKNAAYFVLSRKEANFNKQISGSGHGSKSLL